PIGRIFQAVPTPIVNGPPTLAHVPNIISTAGGAPLSIALSAADPDGNALYFDASGLPDGISIDPNTAVISGVASSGAVGIHAVTASVSDGPTVASANFQWNVIAPQSGHCGLGGELAVILPILQALRFGLRKRLQT